MTNREFYDLLNAGIEDGSIVYGAKELPDSFVKIKVGGRFMAVSVDKAEFLKEIKEKIDTLQFFSLSMLILHTHRSQTFCEGEVERGKYAKVTVNSLKLYIVKDW